VEKTNSLLTTYNLSHTVNFGTRTQNDSIPAIDNIGLSDHDAQFLSVNNTVPATNIVPLKQRIREINNEGIMQFQPQLANETW
jgi:hypothetical protein